MLINLNKDIMKRLNLKNTYRVKNNKFSNPNDWQPLIDIFLPLFQSTKSWLSSKNTEINNVKMEEQTSENSAKITSTDVIGMALSSTKNIYGNYQIFGAPGLVIGAATSILDEYLIRGNYTKKHYLSMTTIWGVIMYRASDDILKLFIKNNYDLYLKIAFTSVSTIGIVMYSQDQFDFKKPINKIIENLTIPAKLYDKDNLLSYENWLNLKNIYDNDGLKSTINKVMNDLILLNQNPLFAKLRTELLADTVVTIIEILISKHANAQIQSSIETIFIEAKESKLNFQLTDLLLQLGKSFGYEVVSFIITFGKNKLLNNSAQNLTENIPSYITKEVFLNETKAKIIISSNDNIKAAKNLKDTVNNLINMGETNTKNLIDEYIPSLLAVKDSIENPRLSVILLLTNFIIKVFDRGIEQKADVNIQNNEIKNIENHIYENMSDIYSNRTSDLIKTRYQRLLDAKTHLENSSSLSIILNSLVCIGSQKINSLLKIILYYQDFKSGKISLTSFISLMNKEESIKHSLGLKEGRTLNWSGLDQSKKLITKLLSDFERDKNNNTKYSKNALNNFTVKNYELSINQKNVLKIDNLVFNHDKTYAITGRSGGGKTTFLKDCSGLLKAPFESKGEFERPQNVKIINILQEIYFPYKCNLLQAIVLKEEVNSDERNLVTELLTTLEQGFNGQTSLVSQLDNNDFQLSGGEKKKIGLVRAILSAKNHEENVILFADEPFNGLNKELVEIFMNLINEHFADAIKIFIDHHTDEQMYDEFYTDTVDFNNFFTQKKTIGDSNEYVDYQI